MKKRVSALALAASMLIASSQANATITVDFAFDGSSLEPGSVTGHLVFDGAGTDVKAIGVYIDSATAAVAPPLDGYQGINFLTGARVTQNDFTVGTDGTISSGALYISSPASYAVVGTTFIQLNGFGSNSFEEDYTQYTNGSFFRAIANTSGFGGATYTAPAVPELGAWAMLTVGFGLIGGMVRRRKAVVPVA